MSDIQQYIIVMLTGLAVTLALTPLVGRLAIRVGAVDVPDARRPHKRPTPRGGGLALVIGVHAACLVALRLHWQSADAQLDTSWWIQFFLASLILLIIGIVDDVHGLKPLLKLAGQFMAACLVSRSGLQFGRLFDMEIPPGLDHFLVVLWIVGVINAFNLIDGLDGLACGLAVIAATGLAGILVIGHVPGEFVVLSALIGAALGFLRYNFHPASIFLGDTGSMFLGFTLGAISLRTLTKDTFVMSFCIPLLVLGVPLYDEILAVWRRSVRAWLKRSQKSGAARRLGLMQPDIEHLHHRLLKMGFSTRRAAGVLYAINAGLVLCGLLLTSFRSHAAGILLIAFLAGAYVLMRQLAVIELRDTGKVILNGLHRPTYANLQALGYPLWDMGALAGATALAMLVLDGPKEGFWQAWFLDLPVWVTPTFSLLAVSRTYVTVWTRARILDVLMLTLTLAGGLLLSTSVALLIDPASVGTELLRGLLVGAVSHPLIILLRISYRLIEESVTYLRNKSETDASDGRTLLYGAGGRCQLYLKERSRNNSHAFDGRVIAGLIDDDGSLHGRWVYGYEVLGGLRHLPVLLGKHRISTILITSKLEDEVVCELKRLAITHGVELREWTFGIRAVDLELPCEAVFDRGPRAVVPRAEVGGP